MSLATRLPRRPTPALTLPITSYHHQPQIQTQTQPPSHTPLSRTPSRAATLIKRPRRPYAFTQLVQLSDGSTYTVRTASPVGLYKSVKDTRNHALWNPNDKSLQNVEVDEAGKLAAFRERFGRGWDAGVGAGVEDSSGSSTGDEKNKDAALDSASSSGSEAGAGAGAGAEAGAAAAGGGGGSGYDYDSLADLISGYAVGMPEPPPSRVEKEKEKDKKK
ncbi:hypothetical protein F5Y14DRAFT_451233 [Nemania sp. NC0429]|nr:hypothetical protein F5Y14DRAFT_451233 [Nemania sp. NC0429]